MPLTNRRLYEALEYVMDVSAGNQKGIGLMEEVLSDGSKVYDVEFVSRNEDGQYHMSIPCCDFDSAWDLYHHMLKGFKTGRYQNLDAHHLDR